MRLRRNLMSSITYTTIVTIWRGSTGRRYLDQLEVLVRELAVGQGVPLEDPGVLQHLLGGESLVGVHVQHLGHQVLGK